MITKAIIEQVINEYKVVVRIPRISAYSWEEDGSFEDTYIATVCSLPNIKLNLKKGAIVYVGFEDNSSSSPIVLGAFLYPNQDKGVKSSISVQDITAIGSVKLPYFTSIGDVTAKQISYLKGVKDNIQVQINNITDRLDTASYGGTGTKDYTQLLNKPSINNVTLSGSLSLNDLGIAPKTHSHTAIITNTESKDSLGVNATFVSNGVDVSLTSDTISNSDIFNSNEFVQDVEFEVANETLKITKSNALKVPTVKTFTKTFASDVDSITQPTVSVETLDTVKAITNIGSININ